MDHELAVKSEAVERYHELAVKSQAVERYFLGEMNQDEREAFEEHFFSCQLCAADVRATSAFVENAKSVLKEKRGWPKPARGWVTGAFLAWVRPSFALAAAGAFCLAIIGYQNFEVIPDLKGPQPITSNVIFDGATRSASARLRAGETLHFQMPWDKGGPAFIELRRNSKTLASGKVPAPAPSQPLEVYFPEKLQPGRYSVLVRPLATEQPAEAIQDDFEVIPQENKPQSNGDR